jgi:hypothetical protein
MSQRPAYPAPSRPPHPAPNVPPRLASSGFQSLNLAAARPPFAITPQQVCFFNKSQTSTILLPNPRRNLINNVKIVIILLIALSNTTTTLLKIIKSNLLPITTTTLPKTFQLISFPTFKLFNHKCLLARQMMF